jgi:HNH endonuclease
MMLTADEVRRILDYNPESGEFHWRVKMNSLSMPGYLAGTKRKSGHWQICIGGKLYLSHRLAWFYMHGCWPPEQVDHVDNNPANNRLVNLRLANSSQNNANKPPRRKIGKGLFYREKYDSFAVRIKVRGKMIHIGIFRNEEDAKSAYFAAAKQHFGEYARM